MFKYDIEALTRQLFDKAGRRDGEEWKQLVLEDGSVHPHYVVSNLGRVLSLPRWRDRAGGNGKSIWKGKVITLSPQRDGHLRFNVRIDNANKTIHVHRAVLWTFVGPQPKGMYVRHLDGNPANNRLDNLSYGKPWENIIDTFAHESEAGIGIVINGELEKRIRDAVSGGSDLRAVLSEIVTLLDKSRALLE